MSALSVTARFRGLVAVLLVLAIAGCGQSGRTGSPGSSQAAGSPAATAAGSASGQAGATSSATGQPGGLSGGSASGSASAPNASAVASGIPSNGQVGNLGPLPQTVSSFQDRIVQVVHEVNPSVCLIETDQGLGSGVVFDDQGDILTNAHVAAGASSYNVTLPDGRRFPATLVGSFAPDDLAVLRIHGTSLHPAVFGDSSTLRVGDFVIAVGNPLGLQSSVTEGIVSALGRVVTEPGGAALPDVIQTSAAINPGNSGGALVDLNGRVVGIPTLAATDPQLGGAAAGIGFAISSRVAFDIAGQLIQHGKVVDSHRAYLGLRLADTVSGGGVVVAAVEPNGPAAKAGIQPGDVIVAVNGSRTPSTGDLSELLASLRPGQTVKVDIARGDGSRTSVNVTVGEYPG